MRKFILILVLFVSTVGLSAQNRWSVYGGLNLSTDEDYAGGVAFQKDDFIQVRMNSKYTVGGFFGVAYDVAFKNGWSIQPAVEYSLLNNKVSYWTDKYSVNEELYYVGSSVANFTNHLHTLAIPVLVNYRVRINENVGLRLGVGPYAQAAVGGKISFSDGTQRKVNDYCKDNRKYQFTAGVKAEIAVETGDHLSYSLGFQRPFCNSVIPKTVTINAGVRYTF